MRTVRFFKTQMKVAPLIGRRDFDAAVQVLEGELTGATEDILHLELIAQCHWQAGNEEKAIETAKKALALDPKNFEMPRMLSQIFAEHEDYEQAIAYVKIGLNNFPSEPLTAPPSWAFSALKLAGKVSAKWKRVEEAAIEDLKDPDKERREWRSWANEYLAWCEDAMKK
jgi:tetratricopeptide (TPR) repeat protein